MGMERTDLTNYGVFHLARISTKILSTAALDGLLKQQETPHHPHTLLVSGNSLQSGRDFTGTKERVMPDSSTYGCKSEKEIKAERWCSWCYTPAARWSAKNCSSEQHGYLPVSDGFLDPGTCCAHSMKRKKLSVLVIGSWVPSVTQAESEHSPQTLSWLLFTFWRRCYWGKDMLRK